MTSTLTEEIQRAICNRLGVDFVATTQDMKIGVSRNLESGIVPINGLRHPVVGDTSGWYLWAGETLSEEDDFFQPLHVRHLTVVRMAVEKFLGLPPGWRFLVAGDYEDVWYDETLLRA